MQTITLAISGMTCGHCVRSVHEALTAVPDVQVQDVRVGSAEIRVPDGDADAAAVIAAVHAAGYDAAVQTPAPSPSEGRGAGGACCPPAAVTPLAAARRA